MSFYTGVNLENIPEELKNTPNWVLWRSVKRDGKWTKPPIDAGNLHAASHSDANTWSTFEVARTVRQSFPDLLGLGFVLTEATGIVGVDFDHVIKDGQITDFQNEIAELAKTTYTEVSPSGTGVRAFLRDPARTEALKRSDLGLEIYSKQRFLTITGLAFEGCPREICSNDELLLGLLNKYGRKKETTPAGKSNLTDDEVLEVIRRSRQDVKFAALYDYGDTSDYGSASEADAGLAGILNFYCANDTDQVERIMRGSALVREKWEERRGSESYLRTTIGNTRSAEVYSRNTVPVQSVSDRFLARSDELYSAGEYVAAGLFAIASSLRK